MPHISIVLVKVISTEGEKKNTSGRLQTPRSALAWLHSLKARHGVWDNGGSRKHCGNQGQWNFPCIIKKGLVCSPRSWEVPLVNPTKVLWLWTPRDEGHHRGSVNPPLILSAPLYRYTLNPLTTSRSNLCRFGWVKQVSDPWACNFPPPPPPPPLPPPLLSSLCKFSYSNSPQERVFTFTSTYK